MGVTLKGFDKQYKKLKSAAPALNKQVAVILGKYGALMVEFARKNHKPFKYKNRQPTGNLERSISFKVDRKNWILEFYIDDRLVTSGGFNYAWVQHDGSGTNYKRSRMSPAVTPKLKTGGVKSDHFMVRAWDKYVDDLTKALEKALIKVLT